ncbi:MAG: molybdopterin-dependent oxidoreductase [Burkholderiales bacterium]|nr:molybdopterin-dependent oxidoreductase [Burkholderiales bacterium]
MTTDIRTNRHSAQPASLNRRDFLVRSAVGGGLMVGFRLAGIDPLGEAHAQSAASSLTPWILIAPDSTVTLQIASTEMGQGIMTGLAQIVADELRFDWSKIVVRHAPVDAAHGGANASPYGRFTGGSLGIRLFSPALQQAGANARQMLIQAAAAQWGVSTAGITANNGAVSGVVGGVSRTLPYGALATAAAAIVLPANVGLNQYPRVAVGASVKRVDTPDKVTGATKFGIDIWVPGMLFAAVKHCPTIGGTVGTVGGKPRNAIAVVPVGATATSAATGVALVASTTWDAMNAARSIGVNWTAPLDLASRDSAAISARAAVLMASGSALIDRAADSGALATGLSRPNVGLNQTYQVPYLAHAALEPLNCTVQFIAATSTSPAICNVWAPTQGPDAVVATTRALCPAGTTVNVVNTLPGSGFGRKFEQDFIREAVQVGLALPGKTVKLTWSREQDFAHDQYRPMALINVQAACAPATGIVSGWKFRTVTPSISVQRGGDPARVDHAAVEGATGAYALDTAQVEWVRHDATIPVGYWRSVGLSMNTFAVESAMDELAVAIGWDPIQLRLANLRDARMIAVLNAVATLSGWSSPAPAGRARGVACGIGFNSYVAQVAEVSRDATSGAIRVHRVSTAVDCGTAINPDLVKAQIEGAVAMAMGPALWQQQTFVNGVAQVTNYNRYRPVKIGDMPQIDVSIVNSGAPLGGIGETGVPCVAPAIANACARLMGAPARRRTLPFFPGTTLGEL